MNWISFQIDNPQLSRYHIVARQIFVKWNLIIFSSLFCIHKFVFAFKEIPLTTNIFLPNDHPLCDLEIIYCTHISRWWERSCSLREINSFGLQPAYQVKSHLKFRLLKNAIALLIVILYV